MLHTHFKENIMKKSLLLLLLTLSLSAKMNIVVSYPYIKDLTQKITQDRATITSLAKGSWDPHFVVPRPSLIVKLRQADLLIINGAQLEIGWLAQLIRQAHNSKITKNSAAFLNLSQSVTLMNELKGAVSRADGDIHPDGNPHYILDPYNVVPLANAIAEKLASLDEKNAEFYFTNADKFIDSWKKKLTLWDKKMAKAHNTKVIQYHELYNYFFKRYQLQNVINIEPLPGITPSSRHTFKVIKKIKQEHIKLIFQDIYHSKKVAKFIASKTDAKILLMPHDVGAIHDVKTLEELFEYLVNQVSDNV